MRCAIFCLSPPLNMHKTNLGTGKKKKKVTFHNLFYWSHLRVLVCFLAFSKEIIAQCILVFYSSICKAYYNNISRCVQQKIKNMIWPTHHLQPPPKSSQGIVCIKGTNETLFWDSVGVLLQ